jgi:NAD-dependent SIR2 family protein deacetylase
LQRWISRKSGAGFVFTSNVDGHFQKNGFEPDTVVECHGAIDFEQCSKPCCQEIWKAPKEEIDVELESFRARPPLPKCNSCGGIARPNILMFGDYAWIEDRTAAQYENMKRWLQERSGCQLAVIEIGAGTAVPTVRSQCQRVAETFDSILIRINPREPGGDNVVSIAMGGLAAVEQMDARINCKLP